MNDRMLIALTVMMIATIVFLFLRIQSQDRLIRDMADKLMARNYTEYVSMTRAREDPPPEIISRKPMSWYDDPNISDVRGDDS